MSLSKMVEQRLKNEGQISAALETHKAAILEGLERELLPYLEEGEELPNLDLLLQLIHRRLRQQA